MFEGYLNWVQSVAFLFDNQKIVFGSSDKMVWVWDMMTGSLLQMLKGYSDWVQFMTFLSDS